MEGGFPNGSVRMHNPLSLPCTSLTLHKLFDLVPNLISTLKQNSLRKQGWTICEDSVITYSLSSFYQILQKIPTTKIKDLVFFSLTTFTGTQERWHYIIIDMICCNATLQKVKANFRKTITLQWLKKKQHTNYYKIKCFSTKLWIKGFSAH